jgi:hypothetical protein
MALKDWKQIGKSNMWKNTRHQKIHIFEHFEGGWAFSDKNGYTDNHFNTKEEAIEFAKEYMEKNQ